MKVFCKKGILNNFAKFTVKHLCRSLFSNEVAGKKHLWTTASEIWSKLQNWQLENTYSKRIRKHLHQSLLSNKVDGWSPVTFTIKKLHHSYFSLCFVKFLRIPILQNPREWRLLKFESNQKFCKIHCKIPLEEPLFQWSCMLEHVVLLEKKVHCSHFSMDFANFLRTHISQSTCK